VVDRLSEPDKYFGANNECQSTSYVSLSQQLTEPVSNGSPFSGINHSSVSNGCPGEPS
jgi:hypothetical protein